MHRDVLRPLYLAAAFCPRSANPVHIVLAGRQRRRHKAAERPRLSSWRIVEPKLGTRRQTHIDRHSLFTDRAGGWETRCVITFRVLVAVDRNRRNVSRSIGWRAIVSTSIDCHRRSVVSRLIGSRTIVS